MLKATLPASIEIFLDADKDTGRIMADPVQVHQIIMNLGTNAAHAMKNTGGRLELKLKDVDVNENLKMVLSELKPGPFVKLTVADTGHGIPFDIQDQIFEPYFTTKDKEEGTGLGLSVVLGIVKTCEGGLSLTSEPGKGTHIDIYFPRIDSPPFPIPKQDVGAELPHGTERILVVDDEIELGKILGNMLEYLGYRVRVESDSLETLRIFKKNPEKFDLVISDVTMPKMTGDKLARALLEIEPGIPILLCSGFSQDITREDVLAIGVKDFLSKPLNIRRVAAKVHKALEKQ